MNATQELKRLEECIQELDARTRELARAETRFRDVIERNADAIVVVDRAGLIRFANRIAIQLFDRSLSDLVGTAFGFPIVVGETTELDLVRGDSPRIVEMRVVASEWDNAPAFIATLRDVTDRKRMEEDARRLIREQAARQAAEATARRFRFLAECGSALSSSLDYTATLAALARLCVEEVADWIVIYVVDDDGAVKRLEVTHRDAQKADRAQKIRTYPLRSGSSPVHRVIETRQPLLVSEVNEEELRNLAYDQGHLELLQDLGLHSFMLVPLIARGRVLGAIALVSADPAHHFTPDDVVLAEDLAMRAALAIDNARLFADAQAAIKTKSDFLALISHDLRTPLNSIIGYADLMELGIPEPLSDGNRDRVTRIQKSASHLLYLMDELLAFARLDARNETRRDEPVELRLIAQDVAAVMDPIATGHGLCLEFELPETPLIVHSDPDKIRRVLLNLVTNAVKYTKQGRVLVTIESGEDAVVMQVQDTGDGIAAEHLPRIFEPFWQVDQTQRTQGGGTGLGLAIVRHLVKLLDGEIAVTSTLGEGSTFTVRLPLQPHTAQKVA